MEKKAPETPEHACRRLAANQHHLITRAQALACGMTPAALHRRKTRGAWTLILPGVYSLLDHRLGPDAAALAASLWADPGSALSHRTAAAAWRIEGFESESTIAVTTTRSLKRPGQWVQVHRVRSLLPVEFGRLGPLVVTSPGRTLIDLAATEPKATLEAAVDYALRTRLVSLPRLRWLLHARPGKGPPGTKALKRLLSQTPEDHAPPESPLERAVWALLEQSDLPRPARQHRIFGDEGVVARVDLAYPDALVAIEVDGYRWHSGRDAWSRDLRRRNRLTALGWRVVHVTHADLQEPDRVVGQIRSLLRERLLCCP